MQKLLITGATSYLGRHLLRDLLNNRKYELILLTRKRLFNSHSSVKEILFDVTRLDEVRDQLLASAPNIALHIGAMASSEHCHRDPEAARIVNVEFTRFVALLMKDLSGYLSYVSTDLVFEGATPIEGGFTEEDDIAPRSVYARTKAEAEEVVLNISENFGILRSCLLCGGRVEDKSGPLGWLDSALREGRQVSLFKDEFRTAVFVEDVALALLKMGEMGLSGVLHCGGPERLSRVDLGKIYAQEMELNQELIVESYRSDSQSAVPRPEDVSLNSRRLYSELNLRFRSIRDAFIALKGRHSL